MINFVDIVVVFASSEKRHSCLFDFIKTAYSLPFLSTLLLVKGGIIGDVKAIDVACTSLELEDWIKYTKFFSSITSWAPIAYLSIFKTLGYDYKELYSFTLNNDGFSDVYTKVVLNYDDAIVFVSLGLGVKTESDLKIYGTKEYVYLKSPW